MFDERLGRIFEIDGYDIDTNDLIWILLAQPGGELAQFALLVGMHHVLRQTKKTTALGFHLNQHNRLSFLSENINFAKW